MITLAKKYIKRTQHTCLPLSLFIIMVCQTERFTLYTQGFAKGLSEIRDWSSFLPNIKIFYTIIKKKT